MVVFFYGSDTFRSQQKLNQIIKSYKAKHKSGMNLAIFDLEEKGLNDFKSFIEAFSMFAEKKLAVIKNLFLVSAKIQEEFFEYLKQSMQENNQEIICVFYESGAIEPKLETQKELFKILIKKPNLSEEFKLLEGAKLQNWIKKEIENRRGKIDGLAIMKLAAFVGSDLWQMNNEIDKLIVYNGKKEIKSADIDLLVKSRLEANIFETIDALAVKDKQKALKLMHKHLEKGEDPFYLLSMYVYQFRNLIKVRDLMEKGISFSVLPKKLKMHPFVIKKTFIQAKNFTLDGLKKIYLRLKNLDILIKTGKIEPKTALDLFVNEV